MAENFMSQDCKEKNLLYKKYLESGSNYHYKLFNLKRKEIKRTIRNSIRTYEKMYPKNNTRGTRKEQYKYNIIITMVNIIKFSVPIKYENLHLICIF